MSPEEHSGKPEANQSGNNGNHRFGRFLGAAKALLCCLEPLVLELLPNTTILFS